MLKAIDIDKVECYGCNYHNCICTGLLMNGDYWIKCQTCLLEFALTETLEIKEI
jgi:hypothetical protein